MFLVYVVVLQLQRFRTPSAFVFQSAGNRSRKRPSRNFSVTQIQMIPDFLHTEPNRTELKAERHELWTHFNNFYAPQQMGKSSLKSLLNRTKLAKNSEPSRYFRCSLKYTVAIKPGRIQSHEGICQIKLKSHVVNKFGRL